MSVFTFLFRLAQVHLFAPKQTANLYPHDSFSSKSHISRVTLSAFDNVDTRPAQLQAYPSMCTPACARVWRGVCAWLFSFVRCVFCIFDKDCVCLFFLEQGSPAGWLYRPFSVRLIQGFFNCFCLPVCGCACVFMRSWCERCSRSSIHAHTWPLFPCVQCVMLGWVDPCVDGCFLVCFFGWHTTAEAANAHRYVTLLEPGEMLYIPPGFWHEVIRH